MEMFPHSGCMVEIHDHWMSGSPHVALAASTVEKLSRGMLRAGFKNAVNYTLQSASHNLKGVNHIL